MAIDFKEWNEEFGGEKAVDAVKKAKENEFTEVDDGTYICKLEKLELGESSKGQPMLKGMFRITEGAFKKQCLFLNQVMTGGFPIHKALEFLRSLQVFEESEIDFNGDFEDFNDLLLDIAEEAEGMKFDVEKSMDGQYTRLEVVDAYDN